MSKYFPFSEKVYFYLKWSAMVALPAATTFIVSVLVAIGIPFAEIIAIIGGALATFIGALVGISSRAYNKNLDDEG